ncbi:MAG: hypothetical protein M3Y87_10850 [Myxococcota bacterium]|nr:hypothetical protein [Myxococcota bacterium]
MLVPALLALSALVATIVMPSGPEIPSIRGVRLGMSAEQVRARFEDGAPASWRTEIAGGDLALIRAPGGSLDRESRFELHNGMLVAIRLDLPDDAPEASGETLAITPGSVTERAPAEPGRVALSVLARDCPTHAEEVSRILSRGP